MNPWENVAKLSRQELRDLQNRKLHNFINHYLYPFSPHYRKLLDDNKIDPKTIKTVDDLKRIPFTSKTDFVCEEQPDKFKDFVQQPDKEKIRQGWPASKLIPMALTSLVKGKKYIEHTLGHEFRPVFMTFTTGTTNRPVPFLYSNYDIKNLHTSGSRMLQLFDIPKSEKLVNMFPYAPHLAFWQVVFGGLASCILAVSTGGGKVMGTEGNINVILRIQPTVLLGVPSYVYHVLRVARDKGCKFDFIKKVVLGASRITPAFKIKIVELLEDMGASDVSVFGTYGFTEARCAWGECPTPIDESSGYFLYPDKEIFEVVDPESGEVKKEGEDGEIVYTSLDSRASTMLRYRTGDFVKGGIVYEPSKYSEIMVPRISSDITRLSNVKDLQLSKIKGTLVNMNNFDAVLSDLELVIEWQVEIRKKNDDPYDVDELVIYVCPHDSCDQSQLELDIKHQMQVSMEVVPNQVNFLALDEMLKRLELETANKEKRFVDSRPKV